MDQQQQVGSAVLVSGNRYLIQRVHKFVETFEVTALSPEEAQVLGESRKVSMKGLKECPEERETEVLGESFTEN